MGERIPAETFHYGEFVQEELSALGWDIEQFSAKAGYSLDESQAILAGTFPMTPELALALGLTFGTSPEMWLALDRLHTKRLTAQSPEKAQTDGN